MKLMLNLSSIFRPFVIFVILADSSFILHFGYGQQSMAFGSHCTFGAPLDNVPI